MPPDSDDEQPRQAKVGVILDRDGNPVPGTGAPDAGTGSPFDELLRAARAEQESRNRSAGAFFRMGPGGVRVMTLGLPWPA